MASAADMPPPPPTTEATNPASEEPQPPASEQLAIDVNDLTFTYESRLDGNRTVLKGLNMQLRKGSRCLLIGANGAGKSTLLRILGGKHLTKPDEAVRVLGRDAFRDMKLNQDRAYLDTNWGMRTVAFAGYGVPLQADIPVTSMMSALQAEFPERRDLLIDILGIDVNWRMHQVSDGQRRRVQLFLSLVRPFEILLLDEVTTALDVVVRQDLLMWLKSETETRNATIVYATHIFDGLDDWPSHIHYLHYHGATGWQGTLEENEHYMALRAVGHPSPMLKVAEKWLRDEIAQQRSLGEGREKADGEAAKIEETKGATSFLNGGGFAPGRMFTHYA